MQINDVFIENFSLITENKIIYFSHMHLSPLRRAGIMLSFILIFSAFYCMHIQLIRFSVIFIFQQGGIYLLEVMDAYAAGWPFLVIGLMELFVVAYIYGKIYLCTNFLLFFVLPAFITDNWQLQKCIKYIRKTQIAFALKEVLIIEICLKK